LCALAETTQKRQTGRGVRAQLGERAITLVIDLIRIKPRRRLWLSLTSPDQTDVQNEPARYRSNDDAF
ncbi:MAG: hypothetical protein AB2733_20465, partial [Candidatus Thiodiazotropha taylori]